MYTLQRRHRATAGKLLVVDYNVMDQIKFVDSGSINKTKIIRSTEIRSMKRKSASGSGFYNLRYFNRSVCVSVRTLSCAFHDGHSVQSNG